MSLKGRFQRSFFRKNKGRKTVQGYFYIGDKRFLKTLCRFEEAGLDEYGEPISKSRSSRVKYQRKLSQLHANKEIELIQQKQNSRQPKDYATFKEITTRWLNVSESGGTKSANTINKIYKPTVKLYLQYVGDHQLTDMSIHHIDSLKKGLSSRGLAKETINLHLRTLRTFCNWAKKREYLEKVPDFEFIPVVKHFPNVYTDVELKKLFSRFGKLIRETNDKRRLRHYIIHERFLYTAVGTGFRRSEILFLEWEQFNLENGYVELKSKDEFNFTIKESEETIRLILPFTVDYLRRIRKENPEERYLLDDGKGNLIYKDKKSISQAFRRHKNELGLNPKVKSIHGFRALFASLAEESGIDIRMIQLLLNHSDPKVTSIYLRRPDQMMALAIKKIDKKMKKIGIA